MSIKDNNKEKRKQEFLRLLEISKECEPEGLLVGSFESFQKLISGSLIKENK